MKFDVCILCKQRKNLCKSHVIPNSIFKGLFKKASGKAIALSNQKDIPILYSQESYASYLLCSDCEKNIDKCYEKHSLNVLRNHEGKSTRSDDGIKFNNINTRTIRDFIYTIIWRAHHSEKEIFRHVKLESLQEEEMRMAFKLSL